jgi:hypothetical protein
MLRKRAGHLNAAAGSGQKGITGNGAGATHVGCALARNKRLPVVEPDVSSG